MPDYQLYVDKQYLGGIFAVSLANAVKELADRLDARSIELGDGKALNFRIVKKQSA